MASGGGGSLLTFVVRRLLITILLLFLISLGVYSLILIIPGNPAIALAGGHQGDAGGDRQDHGTAPPQRGLLRPVLELVDGSPTGEPGQLPLQQRDGGLGHRRTFPGHAQRGGRRDDRRHPARHPRGHRVRAAPGHRPGPRGHRRLEHRRGHPRLLARHDPRDRLRGEAGMAPRTRLHAVHPVSGRMVPGPAPAVAGARHRRVGGDRTPGARCAHRHPGSGLHAHRGGQGSQPPHGGRESMPSRTPSAPPSR